MVHISEQTRTVDSVSSTRILDTRWPEDLDPETVPFATRTVTVLQRHGLYDDPARFNTLTVAEVAGWTNTGPVTIVNHCTTESLKPSGSLDRSSDASRSKLFVACVLLAAVDAASKPRPVLRIQWRVWTVTPGYLY